MSAKAFAIRILIMAISQPLVMWAVFQLFPGLGFFPTALLATGIAYAVGLFVFRVQIFTGRNPGINRRD